ncbi:MAG TPA: uracil phosphoribosyltransferase [Spirochaetia bacterium]|nr:uracil phosphoribosyltransferase [Spirochaetales bacterium]HRY73003.1 uracil phosphoribosyltransferase [Spirochaetia bacterium]
MSRVVLKAQDLDGYLGEGDKVSLARMDALYREAMLSFSILSSAHSEEEKRKEEARLIDRYNEMGSLMQEICASEPRLQVYSFVTPSESHGEASRLIAKLRDVGTGRQEFVYYIQRAYELLFNMTFGGAQAQNKNYLIVKTPVTAPVQNYAVHKIPNLDEALDDTVMCVMLRGALLPSMIMSKEIQEFSSRGYVTPFALFKIKRDDSKSETTMEYILDLDRSYFKLEALDGKDLVFADPMNATGGSLVTVIKYLQDKGVRPRSVKFVNVISALKGALRIVRAIDNATVHTLWMDPVLNDRAYIMPGLGDAGDRINGKDEDEAPRDMLRLIADYGSNITSLYRSQLRTIEETVLRR